MVAVAIVGAGVIGAVGSSVASSNAAGAQEDAANQANATDQQQYYQTRSDLLPYNTAGQNALNSLVSNNYYNNPLTLPTVPQPMTEAQLEQTPGYQFNLTQGLKATQNAAAARGLGVSGAALKGAASYATGLADSTYQNQFNNAQAIFGDQQTNFQNQQTQQQNNYNRLLGIGSLGENAAAQTGNVGSSLAANEASNTVGAGNAAAASNIATGNAIGNAANSVSNAYLTNAFLQGNGGAGGIYGDSSQYVGG
jgi:hypothetical protein